MSKLLLTPASRLICFGGARALTNSPAGERVFEDDPVIKYNPS
jgi:hypothetical protein